MLDGESRAIEMEQKQQTVSNPLERVVSSDWEPKVGLYAVVGVYEYMIIAEHNGCFWCKNKSGVLMTFHLADLEEPKDYGLINEMRNTLIAAQPMDSREAAEVLIAAGYRKCESC